MVRFYATIFVVIFSAKVYSIQFAELPQLGKTEKYNNRGASIMVTKEDKLFIISTRGLQVFSVKEQHLELVTDFELDGNLSGLSLENDYAYVSAFYKARNIVYRINIANIISPVITDTLDMYGSYVHFNDMNNLYVHERVGQSWVVNVFNNETFENVASFDVPHRFWAMEYLGEGKGFINNQRKSYIYDISNPEQVEYLGDLAEDSLSYPCKAKLLNDSILVVASMMSKVKIYNINNYRLLGEINRQVSNFSCDNGKLVLIENNHAYLYDIVEPTYPILADQIDIGNDRFTDLCVNGDDLFLSTLNGKLFYYSIAGEAFNKMDAYYNWGGINSGCIANNTLVIQSDIYNLINIDITNVENQKERNKNSFDYYSISTIAKNNYVMQFYYDDESRKVSNAVFNINKNGENVRLYTEISIEGFGAFHQNDEIITLNNNVLGYYSIVNNKIKKSTEKIIAGINNGSLLILDDYILIITPQELLFVSANKDDSNIISRIKLKSSGRMLPVVKKFEDYLFVSHDNGITVINIGNINEPKELLTLNISGEMAIDAKNKLLFVGTNAIEVFDISTLDEGSIESVSRYGKMKNIVEIIPLEQNGKYYLICLDIGSVRTFQYK